jgi:O-antigen/teichoic acid export membrane protein
VTDQAISADGAPASPRPDGVAGQQGAPRPGSGRGGGRQRLRAGAALVRRDHVRPGGASRPAPGPGPGAPAATGRASFAASKLLGLRRQLTDPLSRNGYALVANSGATGLLGLVYWVLVARLYPTAVVGRASAAYAAMNLLAGFTALNFTGALTRFLPQAGHRTKRLVTHAYLVSGLASVLVAVPFLLTISRWGPSYAELANPIVGVFFVGSVVTWAVFTLQDGVLTGLRSAVWVLLENGLFGMAKIVLLVLFAARLPHLGIYLSWMVPALAAVPLVNLLIYGRLVPRHTAATLESAPPTGRQIGRFLAGDYSGAMFLLATTNLVPVLVAARIADVRYTAYFYMAWMVGGVLDLVGVNMAMSLTVEGSFDASTLAVNCRKALRKIAGILLPCAALTALLAEWGLSLFGPGYAEHGAPVLQLLAVATLPRAVTEVYLGTLRAQSRTSLVAIIQGSRCVAMLGLTVILVTTLGPVGAGLAAVLSQGAVALVILPGLWRVLAGSRATRTAPGAQQASADTCAPEASAP